MATLIVHAGLHKTGTSSIQETLAALPAGRGPAYLWIVVPNMSGVIRKVFQPLPRLEKSFGAERAAAFMAEKPALTQRLRELLRRNRDRDCILSAESFSLLSERELADFLAMVPHDSVRFLAYARDPWSAMPSEFQQRVKDGGLARFSPESWVPKYRARLEKFVPHGLEVFCYDRATLRNGCVVQDFLGRIGIDIRPEEVRNTNESVGRDAVALLYCRNRWRQAQGLPKDNSVALRPRLAELAEPRLRLHPDLVGPAVAAAREDMAWVEARMGRTFARSPAGDDAADVSSEEDLLRFSAAADAWLGRHVPGLGTNRDPMAVGAAIDALILRDRQLEATGAVVAATARAARGLSGWMRRRLSPG
jgi:hypothetical protein